MTEPQITQVQRSVRDHICEETHSLSRMNGNERFSFVQFTVNVDQLLWDAEWPHYISIQTD